MTYRDPTFDIIHAQNKTRTLYLGVIFRYDEADEKIPWQRATVAAKTSTCHSSSKHEPYMRGCYEDKVRNINKSYEVCDTHKSDQYPTTVTGSRGSTEVVSYTKPALTATGLLQGGTATSVAERQRSGLSVGKKLAAVPATTTRTHPSTLTTTGIIVHGRNRSQGWTGFSPHRR